MIPVCLISHCHDRVDRGAALLGGPAEWDLAFLVNDGISRSCRDAGLHTYRLGGKLEDRIKGINDFAAHAKNALCAVETHFNWSADPHRRGYHVQAYHGAAQSIALAECVLEKIGMVMETRNMGVNLVSEDRQWIGMPLREYETHRQAFCCQTDCPAILVEAGFLSNEAEAKWLLNETNRSTLGEMIGSGVVEYFNRLTEVSNVLATDDPGA